MEAVGRYLRVVRDARQLTQEEVGRALGVSDKQVGRWEHGRNEPLGGVLAKLCGLIDADPDDVMQLFRDETATAEDGQRLAELRLAPGYAERKVNGLSGAIGQDQAEAIARRLSADPAFADLLRRAVENSNG